MRLAELRALPPEKQRLFAKAAGAAVGAGVYRALGAPWWVTVALVDLTLRLDNLQDKVAAPRFVRPLARY